MDWSWAASCRNRGQRDLRFPKRRATRPKLMRRRRRLDEKPTSERRGVSPPTPFLSCRRRRQIKKYEKVSDHPIRKNVRRDPSLKQQSIYCVQNHNNINMLCQNPCKSRFLQVYYIAVA